jgi:arginase family enzyme
VVSISLEAIEGVTGVSRPCLTGITTEEAIEVCLQVGNSSKVVAIDICDYNPFIEDWSTGRLVATMFYHLALGYSARL